jgi:hypothetical protein
LAHHFQLLSVGQGTRDMGQNGVWDGMNLGGRGSFRAETEASSEWRMVLEGSAPALPRKIGA